MKIFARTIARDLAIGAPVSVHRFLDHLRDRGHEVEWAWQIPRSLDEFDVVILSAQMIEGIGIKARRADARLAIIVHSAIRQQLADIADLIVWNTTVQRGDRPGIVCHPPTHPAEYATTPGDMVTLVNLSEEKGGELFGRIARGLPDSKFLGVTGGYGRQYPQHEPNVLTIPSTQNMRDDVYGRTRVLLMPSVTESWGMVGVEAMASGIPVIAHPTPGLRESLGDAGIFCDRADVHGWIEELRRLEDPDAYAEASERALKRSAELDPLESLDRFADAIEALA